MQAGCLALHKLLKLNPPMAHLNLSWNGLGSLEQGVHHIATALTCNDNLETLTIANCQVGHNSAQAIANTLMTNNCEFGLPPTQLPPRTPRTRSAVPPVLPRLFSRYHFGRPNRPNFGLIYSAPLGTCRTPKSAEHEQKNSAQVS